MQSKGFTLIELVVVISLLMILSLGAFFGLNPGGLEARVEASATLLARNFERARDLTLHRVIDPTCEKIYEANSTRRCSQYHLLLNTPNTNEYLVLPQEAAEDASTDFNAFYGTKEILEEGTKILTPQSKEAIDFRYIPDESIRIETNYSSGNCENPSDPLGTITITDTFEKYFVDVFFFCNGRVETQKR